MVTYTRTGLNNWESNDGLKWNEIGQQKWGNATNT